MKVIVKNARLAFANLFKATTVNGEGDPSYSCSLILTPGAQVSIDGGKTFGDPKELLTRAITLVGKEKWADKAGAILKTLFATDKVCLHDGDNKKKPDGTQYDGFEGNYYVSTRLTQKPRIIDSDKTELTEASGKPYSGCYVNASIELWTQDNNYGKRVNAQVRVVQFANDGDSFGGGGPVSETETDAFDVLDAPESAVDDLM